MNTADLIATLEAKVDNPTEGLPEELFEFVSRVTPLVNVDLLIKNASGETLLTWRDDGFHPQGWHVPGGIIRYRERASERIEAVALHELGAHVQHDRAPLLVEEVFPPSRRTRGHFISMLFKCHLESQPDQRRMYRGATPKGGEWSWHSKCPDDLLEVQEMYRVYINEDSRSLPGRSPA